MSDSGSWHLVCRVEDIPKLGARVVMIEGAENVAIFRTALDNVFALLDRCPHKGGPLSQGIVSGETVTCPLHNWNINLADGQSRAPDIGCVDRFKVRVEDGEVWLAHGSRC